MNVFYANHLTGGGMSLEAVMNLIHDMCSEVTLLKLPPRLAGDSELKEMRNSYFLHHQGLYKNSVTIPL